MSFRPPHKYSTSNRLDKCVTRLRLGYNLLPGSLGHHIVGVSAICPTCGVKNTTDHFLVNCNDFILARQKLYNVLVREGVDFNIGNILYPPKALQPSVFGALENFIIECRMTEKI